MANVTVNRTDLFPNGTLIKAYTQNSYHPGQEGGPTSKSVAEATMTAGVAELTGLTAGQTYTVYALVGGKDTALLVQAPASTAIVAATGLPEPSLQGLLAASFDPALASGTFQLTPAGTLHVVRIPIKEEIKIQNLLLYLTTKGATLTALQCFAAIFGEARQLLGKATPAETIAKMEGANGSLQTIPLEAPVVVGPGNILAGLFYNGTTAPTFSAGPVATAALINAGASGTKSRFATGDTGLTTAPPATVTAAMAAAANPIWVGVN